MRNKGTYGKRLDKNESDIIQMKRDLDDQKAKYEEHIERHISDDLKETRYNGKPMYSYADIADRHNVPTSTVQRVAIKEGLTRRKKA